MVKKQNWVYVIQTIPGLPSKAGEEEAGRVRLAALDTSLTSEGLNGEFLCFKEKSG